MNWNVLQAHNMQYDSMLKVNLHVLSDPIHKRITLRGDTSEIRGRCNADVSKGRRRQTGIAMFWRRREYAIINSHGDARTFKSRHRPDNEVTRWHQGSNFCFSHVTKGWLYVDNLTTHRRRSTNVDANLNAKNVKGTCSFDVFSGLLIV